MPDTTEPSGRTRLLWFFGIALASALIAGLIAEALRWLLLH